LRADASTPHPPLSPHISKKFNYEPHDQERRQADDGKPRKVSLLIHLSLKKNAVFVILLKQGRYIVGRIRSALEIAMERTETVKGDKGSIEQFDAKQRGKKLANEFLEGSGGGNAVLLEQEIKKTPAGQRAAFRQGIFDALLSQIALPLLPEDEKRVEEAGRGLQAVIGDGKFTALCKQLSQYISRYTAEARQYDAALRQQYAPKLRQKEEEFARRTGQQIRLDPFQDPEFVAYYNQNINALKANYQQIIDQVKEQASALFR
jgi:hypothetical protein